MQDGQVLLVTEGTEDRALIRARIRQHGKRLIGMAGQIHMVILSCCALLVSNMHFTVYALYVNDSAASLYRILIGRNEAFKIFLTAAGDSVPLRLLCHGQQAMLLEE